MKKTAEINFTDMTVGDFLKISTYGLQFGQVIYLENGTALLVGNCTPFTRPNKNSDTGWDWNKDYGNLKIKKIEYYEIPGYTEGPDYKEVT